jgi:hypothetical protein
MLNSTDILTIRSPEVIVTTPFIEKATSFMLDCCGVGGWGLITGDNGSGKTITLQRLAARYEKQGLAGSAFYFCCRPAEGTTRAVKDLLAEMEIGGALMQQGNGAPLQLLFKIAFREFKRRDIRLILFDESTRCDSEAIEGIVALYDYMREKGHPLTIILASNVPRPEWVDAVPSARSRTLAMVQTQQLDIDLMLGVVREWTNEFAKLADSCDDGNKDAAHTVEAIHARVGTNLRRLNYFVRLYLRHFQGEEVTLARVKEVFARMTEGAG